MNGPKTAAKAAPKVTKLSRRPGAGLDPLPRTVKGTKPPSAQTLSVAQHALLSEAHRRAIALQAKVAQVNSSASLEELSCLFQEAAGVMGDFLNAYSYPDGVPLRNGLHRAAMWIQDRSAPDDTIPF